MNKCPKCGSNAWDHANVGLIGAVICTNCGEIYMLKDKTKMTEEEFENKFDNGDLDCAFCDFICERYDAWDKHKMLSYWEDPDAYQEFKDSMVTVTSATSVVEKQQYSLGPNPLDKFPSMWRTPK
jgi:hypothetical protein